MRINQFIRAERAAAFLALVTVCAIGTAFRASADDISIRKELLAFGIEVLLRLFLDELPFVIEFLEELLSRGTVHLRRGTRVDVVADAQLLERLLDDGMVAVDDVLWRHAFFLSLDGNRHAVLVGTTDKQHFLTAHSQIADIGVGGDVNAGKVTNVDGAVGVWQGRGYRVTLESFVTK